MRRPSALTFFVLSAFAWVIALTLIWTKISPWTSYPVAVLSEMVLEHGAPMWVRAVHTKPGLIEVDTTVSVYSAEAGGQHGEIVVDANPGRYAYGLPILLGLMLAAGGRGRWTRALGGYLLLLPAQAFSLSMYLLMQTAMGAQANVRTLRIDQWQLEAIIYGYQMGALVLPTLAPIVVWLWLDRRFFNEVIVQGWRVDARQPGK